MTEKKDSIYDLNELQLIQLKKNMFGELESRYFNLLDAERTLKNVENKLYLETDFKAQGLTNDKQRNAYVSDQVSSLRFEVDMAKYQLKLQEDLLKIIDDLIRFTQREVKTE